MAQSLWLAGHEGMEKKMETTITGYTGAMKGSTGVIWGLYRNNGKEHGNCHNGLHRDYSKDPFLHT